MNARRRKSLLARLFSRVLLLLVLLVLAGAAAALYAFAQARAKAVLCFTHVTNQMGQAGDFEKGEANGATASLALVHAVADAWLYAER